MDGTTLFYGIPDLVLPRVGGGTINPSTLVGHELVVFFCPAGAAEASSEIAAYSALMPDFEDAGAWVMGVLTGAEPAGTPDRVALASDSRGSAWAAFETLIEEADRSAGHEGGAFLFGRGGCLTRAWRGSGHARDVLAALRQRG